MLTLLVAFSLFNLCAGAACVGLGVRLFRREARAAWASRRLLFVAALLCLTFPPAAAAGVFIAWSHYLSGALDAVAIVLAPIGWLVLLGVIFAIIDFAEDGVFDFGRGPRRDAP
ncbi:MAG: hypothetical protein HXY28_07790 [Hydrogenophilaceae bacterium]|jgi:hypothetical protein|nr:hypothetical protein [Hydrogenophilaceae bacterium]